MDGIPDGAHSRSFFVTRSDFRNVEAIGSKARLKRIDVGNLPGEAAKAIGFFGLRIDFQLRADLDRRPTDTEKDQPDASLLEGLVQSKT